MSKRTITIYSQATSQSKEIESDATKWGQLKKAVEEAIMNSISTVKAVVRETRNTLDNDDAVLPEGAFTIFLLPVKVKSGLQTRLKDGRFGGKAKTKKKVATPAKKKVIKKSEKKVTPKKPVKKALKVKASTKKLSRAQLKKEADKLRSKFSDQLTRCHE